MPLAAVTGQREDAGRRDASAHASVAACEVHAPTAATSGKLDAARRKGLRRERVLEALRLTEKDRKGYEAYMESRVLELGKSDLARLSKGAPEKTALAWWLRERTTVSLRWVGQTLAMGHYTRVTQAVSRMKRRPGRKLEAMKQRLLKTERTR